MSQLRNLFAPSYIWKSFVNARYLLHSPKIERGKCSVHHQHPGTHLSAHVANTPGHRNFVLVYTRHMSQTHIVTHLSNMLSKMSGKARFWKGDGGFRKGKMRFGSSCNNIGNCCRGEEKEAAKRTTKWLWTKPWITMREQHGAYPSLLKELRLGDRHSGIWISCVWAFLNFLIIFFNFFHNCLARGPSRRDRQTYRRGTGFPDGHDRTGRGLGGGSPQMSETWLNLADILSQSGGKLNS